jgi:glycogen debranching enzyme
MFDIHEIPLSRRGSWLDISPVIALHTTHQDLHLVSHQTGMHAVLRFQPETSGAARASTFSASATQVAWDVDGGGRIVAVFDTVDTVRLRGAGTELRIADAASVLTPFTGTYLFRDPIDGSAVFTSYETGRRYRVTAIRGELVFDGAEALGQNARTVIATGPGGWEIAIEEFETARPSYVATSSFDEAVTAVESEWREYLQAVAGWRTNASPGAELATYVIWSATVAPKGFLKRESVLMSKHWMDKVWSWDHCFNALALAPAGADVALGQFLTPFDHLDAAGAMPDSVTHSEILYNFVKPPIHGWALAKLRGLLDVPLDRESIESVYGVLSRWGRFWLDARRVPGHPLPHYQHGNDSGWDNSSTFDLDRLIESPDLAAFLVVQFDVLAGLADELGNADGDDWRRERDLMRDALVATLWDGDHFVAEGVVNRRTSKTSSLLNLVPVLAADHLPADIVVRLAADVEGFLTEFGPATQLPGTPEYEADGYWRGPIWAPSTVLIENGLRRAGFIELADTVSERFRALCEKSGFAENFDALTGEGLRDRAYTWTASAYLLLAREAEARVSSSAAR